MKLKNRILIYFGTYLTIVIAAVFVVNYGVIRKKMKQNAFENLEQVHSDIHRASEVLLSTAIESHLHGITLQTMAMIEFYYEEHKSGKLTESEAKDSIQDKCRNMRVGKTGYITIVERGEENLSLAVHPFLRGEDCSDAEACLSWDSVSNGFVEYNWKNPAEAKLRKKVAYVEEFPEWNWIVGATSYSDEFVSLVDIDDLRNMIAPIKINRNGYFFVFDDSMNNLIHPELEGLSMSMHKARDGELIFDKLVNAKNGYATYWWKNPSERKYYQKYAYVKEMTEFGWYIAATGYIHDIFEPLNFLSPLTIILTLFAVGMLIFVIALFNQRIIDPLMLITKGVESFYRNNTPFKWRDETVEEITFLGKTIENMTFTINNQVKELQSKMKELDLSHEQKEKANRLLDSILNSMPSLIVGISSEQLVTQWNPECEKFTGIAADDAKGMNILDIFSSFEPVAKSINECLGSEAGCKTEFSVMDEDYQQNFYELIYYPLGGKESSGAVIRIDDVTSRKKLEQEVGQSRKMDAIGQLAGGVAHDFNNMLTGILSSVEELEEGGQENTELAISIIKQAALRTRDLTKNLLDFSRQSTRGMEKLEMHEIITSTIHMLSHTISKSVRIHVKLNAENDCVKGDLSQLQNVLLNIGINASHAMGDGGDLTYRTTIDETGANFIVEIEDTGCGIPDSIAGKIFEPFFTTKGSGNGTGLGLASAFAVIKQHEGVIKFDTVPNKGTTFRIILPLYENEEEEQSEGVRMEEVNEPRDIGGKKTILVIEDEPIIQLTVKKMLEIGGYEVMLAENGKVGYEMYQDLHSSISMVLLDMVMPEMNGPECFKSLINFDPKVKVVVSSGYSKEGEVAKMEQDGLAGFVAKPYRKDEFLQEVARVINLP